MPAQPRVFYARFLDRCSVCDRTIEPGEAVAYDNEKLVHAAHHDDPRVRNAPLPPRPFPRRHRRR